MQLRFNTRNYSIRDFEEWSRRDGELVLAPKFQRRSFWNPKARSYLMDTIIRGKPIPKLYMRQDVNPKNRRTTREIVDGQQRLQTVLSFLKDGFKILKTHDEEDIYGGRVFSELDDEIKRDILRYEFVVDLLQDMPDSDVYDVFARINTYSEKLRPQELRNAKWFGEFKSSVYLLARELTTFLETNRIFTPNQILRMAEAEFISELLLAVHEGIREGKKSIIEKAYKDYDDDFPNRKRHESRFKHTIDAIGDIAGADLQNLEFRATRLFYPLFCSVFHMQFELPRLNAPRRTIKDSHHAKLKTVLEEVNELVDEIAASERSHEPIDISAEDRKFYQSFKEHWVHAANRTVLTQYLCNHFTRALK